MKPGEGNGVTDVIGALGRLDHLLKRGIDEAENAYGQEAAGDRFRGLQIAPAEVARLLTRQPGEPVFANARLTEQAYAEPLASLSRKYGLAPFDVDALLVALGPEVDLRYERLYAYLQDDVTMKRPTVDLILNLLCDSPAEKIAARAAFEADGALLRHRLVRLDGVDTMPLLRRTIAVDEQIVRLLLGTRSLDSRLAPFVELTKPEPGEPPRGDATAVTPLRLYLRGRPGSGRRRAAEALAAREGLMFLAADLASMPDGLAEIVVREAALHDALLYASEMEALADRPRELAALAAAVSEHQVPFVIAGRGPWVAPVTTPPLGLPTLQITIPETQERRRSWEAALNRHGVNSDPSLLDLLAGRFRLNRSQIAIAAAEAVATTRWQGGQDPQRDALFAAARAQTGHALEGLARKLVPSYSWEDITLPNDTLLQLRELCARIDHRERVLSDWGFGTKSLGNGVSALFAGPPGTGKTMAAEVVANELGVDLYRIDLSGVVSKWIGETEKNLDRIFASAEDANEILFFDEADALFGKRSEVKDAHDRYANVEVSYLLQKMEEYDGVAILATNRIDHLDEAFLRRLSFVVRFPFPEEKERLRIWSSVWPDSTPLGEDIELPALAHEFSFSGAEIKNVGIAAAFLAAERGTPVTNDDVRHAVRREYEKAGRSFDDRHEP